MARTSTESELNQPTGAPVPEILGDEKSHSLWWHSWRRMRKNRLAMVGLVIVVGMTLVAIFAPFVAPMDPNRQVLEYVRKESGFQGNILVLKSFGGLYDNEYVTIASYKARGDSIFYQDVLGRPNIIPRSALIEGDESDWHQEPRYILGADGLGRDVLSRLIFGARTSLSIGLIAELISLSIGLVLGALAGYFRGWVDAVVMYAANVIWSFPFILLVIALSLVWSFVWTDKIVPFLSPILPFLKGSNTGFWQAFIAIGIANWVDTARIVRGQFFSLRETEYVEATRALGFGSFRTIFRHMLPNSLGPITVITTAGFASAIIAEASLSYLGLGVSIPMASWGQMVSDGFGNIMGGSNWGLAIYPSVVIALAVFAFNMLGDGLRDALDPKLNK